MKKVLLVVSAVLMAALLVAGGFWGGMTYQTRQADQVRANFMNARGMADQGQFPGGGMPDAGQMTGGGMGFAGRGGTMGTVKSIDEDVLTISTAQDVTTVNLTEDTQIEMTVTGTIADLQAGMRVTVVGERDDDDVISASRISILSDSLPPILMDQQSAYPPPAGMEP